MSIKILYVHTHTRIASHKQQHPASNSITFTNIGTLVGKPTLHTFSHYHLYVRQKLIKMVTDN